MKTESKEKSIREKYTVCGVGNWGANIVKAINPGLRRRVKTMVVNSDLQSLICSNAQVKLQIGKKTAAGRGTGGDREAGEKAFRESESDIHKSLSGTEVLILVTGLGGGLGSAVTPALCRLTDKMGIFTLVLATQPFEFEGKKKAALFGKSLEEIRKSDSCLIWFNLDRLLGRLDENTPYGEAFQRCDGLLQSALESLIAYLTAPPPQGGDCALLKNIFSSQGESVLGTHQETGSRKLVSIMKGALSNLFLNVHKLSRVRGCLIQIRSGKASSIGELRQAISAVAEMLNEEVHLAFCIEQDEELGDEVKVNLLIGGVPVENEEETSSPFLVTMKTDYHPPKQTEMDFAKMTRGNFSGTEPTVKKGEDLDIPTFIRRGEKLA